MLDIIFDLDKGKCFKIWLERVGFFVVALINRQDQLCSEKRERGRQGGSEREREGGRERFDFIPVYILPCNYPACIYPLKVNNRNTRTRCEICSKLTIKTSERR